MASPQQPLWNAPPPSPIVQPGEPGFNPTPATSAPLGGPPVAASAVATPPIPSTPGATDASTPAQPIDPIADLIKRIQDNQAGQEQNRKSMEHEKDPDAIFDGMPNGGQRKPSEMLRDWVYNTTQLNLRNPIYGSLAGQPYKPIEQQRYEQAQNQQMQRIKIAMDQGTSLQQEGQSMYQELQARQALQRQQENNAVAQGRLKVYGDMATEKQRQDDLMKQYRQAKLDQDAGISGAKLRLEGIQTQLKSISQPFTAIVSQLEDEAKARGEKLNLNDPDVQKDIQDFIGRASVSAMPKVTQSTPTPEGGTNSISFKAPPGTTLPLSTPTSTVRPPIPGFTVAQQANNAGAADVDIRSYRAFDPVHSNTDRMAMLIGQDSKNLDMIQKKGPYNDSNPSLSMVTDRMKELGIDPNNVSASIRDRSALAAQALDHLTTIDAMINKAKADGDLGILMTHWNRFLSQDVGFDPTEATRFSELDSNLKFLVSAVAMTHGGQRAGASVPMNEVWAKALKAADPDTMQSKLKAARDWMTGYSQLAGPNKQVGPDRQKAINDSLVMQYGGKK